MSNLSLTEFEIPSRGPVPSDQNALFLATGSKRKEVKIQYLGKP